MRVELLHTLHLVHSLGGVRAAAGELHLTQPAVSQRLRQLEQEAGFAVFERVGRRLQLTQKGEQLLEQARVWLQSQEDFLDALELIRDPDRGRLRISTLDAASIYLLPRVFVEFRAHYPKVELRVQVSDSRRVLRDLARFEADLGFVAMPSRRSPQQTEVSVQAIFKDELICVASPDHPLTRKRGLGLADIARFPLILYEQGSTTRAIIDRSFERAGVQPTIAMETASPEAMKELVAAGVGLSILPRLHLGPDLSTRRLRQVQLKRARFVRWIGLARQAKRPLHQHAETFLRILRQRLPA